MGWLLPAPGGKVKISPPETSDDTYAVNNSASSNCLRIIVSAVRCPRGPPNILVKFRSKIPLPLPVTGGTPCLELKQASSGPTAKKILGAPAPPTGEIWGVKFSTFPPPPSNSSRQRSEFFRPRAGLDPGYNPRDFGKCACEAAGDIFTFILAPGPMVCIMAQTYKSESIYSVGYSSTYKSESIYSVGYSSTLCVIGVDAGNAVTPSTGPIFSQRAHVPRPYISP